jgi:hypothetical protein
MTQREIMVSTLSHSNRCYHVLASCKIKNKLPMITDNALLHLEAATRIFSR